MRGLKDPFYSHEKYGTRVLVTVFDTAQDNSNKVPRKSHVGRIWLLRLWVRKKMTQIFNFKL
jgi:hypothetical protein